MGCSSLEKIYIPEQYIDCGLMSFPNYISKKCTVYGTEGQKKFIIRSSADFENKSGHEHIMVTETIAEPGEVFYGAEVTYCTYCNYIEEGKLTPLTGTQVTVTTISTPVLKTPAPVVNETHVPEETAF